MLVCLVSTWKHRRWLNCTENRNGNGLAGSASTKPKYWIALTSCYLQTGEVLLCLPPFSFFPLMLSSLLPPSCSQPSSISPFLVLVLVLIGLFVSRYWSLTWHKSIKNTFFSAILLKVACMQSEIQEIHLLFIKLVPFFFFLKKKGELISKLN